MGRALFNLDVALLIAINGFRSDIADVLMWNISGKWQWIPLYFFLLVIFYKKYSIKTFLLFILFVVILISLSDQTAGIFKQSIERFRPAYEENLSSLLHFVNDYKGGKYGFYSAHASNSMALAVFVFLLLRKKWVGIGLILWVFLVSYSRVYLGVHYPSDILAGWIAGGMIGAGVYIAFQWLDLKLHKKTCPKAGF